MNEIKRQAGKREQLLSVLRAKPQGVTNVELSQNVSLRYGGHLGKLYELGYKIEKEALGGGLFLYKLIEEPKVENHDRKKAIDVLLDEVKKEEIIDAEILQSMLDKLGINVKYKAGTYNAS